MVDVSTKAASGHISSKFVHFDAGLILIIFIPDYTEGAELVNFRSRCRPQGDWRR